MKIYFIQMLVLVILSPVFGKKPNVDEKLCTQLIDTESLNLDWVLTERLLDHFFPHFHSICPNKNWNLEDGIR